MKKTSFSKFTNVQSDPIILDFDSDYSQPRLASPLPEIPKKIDPNATQIPDIHCNVKYERRTKYRAESRGIPVVEYKQRMITEDLEFPKERSINEDTTDKDVPPKVRRYNQGCHL